MAKNLTRGASNFAPTMNQEAVVMLIIRNFRWDDLFAWVDLVNEIEKADKRGQLTSVHLKEEFLRQPHLSPEQDYLLAQLGDKIVGYGALIREVEEGRLVLLKGGVHPSYRRRGIGTRLLEAALEHGRGLGARRLQIPLGRYKTLSQHFLKRRGFKLVHRQKQMKLAADVAAPPPFTPSGFQLRSLARGEEAGLTALQNLAFSGSWGFRPNRVEEIKARLKMSYSPSAGVRLLLQGQKIVSYCWTTIAQGEREGRGGDRGYISMIGVDPAYQGQGLGRAVLLAGIDYLRKRGVKEIELTVNYNNLPAIELYRSLGFKDMSAILWYEKALS